MTNCQNTINNGEKAINKSPVTVEPGLHIYGRNNRRTQLRSCSKEGFRGVNTSIANISFEIRTPAIISALRRPLPGPLHTWKA